MDANIYQLLKDFYTLKAEYEMNMQQLQKINQKITDNVDRLTKGFNELRDSIVEHVEKLHT